MGSKYLQAKKKSAINVINARLKVLEKEQKLIQEIEQDQRGTEIPRSFSGSQVNFIIDPSNIGTGILDRMIKTDDTINSAVQFKIMMILSKIGEYEHSDPVIKDFVQGFLNGMSEPTWESTMESMLSYHGYRFSVSEVVFGVDTDLRKVPMKIVTYHPSTIAFEVDEVGEITPDGIIQYTNQRSQFANLNWRFQAIRHGFKVNNPFETPVDRLFPHRVMSISDFAIVRIPRDKCIHLKGQEWHAFGSPYGNSGVRTAHLLWQLKVFLFKQMGIASKRKGTPKIWATAPKGANKVRVKLPDGKTEELNPQEAVSAMLKNIENYDSFVTGAESEGYKLTVLDDTSDLTQFTAVIDALDVRIFRCFLLPSLVMTDGSAGSRSLGDKHFEIVDQIAEADADKFTTNFIKQILERVIAENFGEQEDYGQFNRRPQTSEERERLARMYGQLANDGWMSPLSKQDMDYVRDSLKLSPLEGDFFTDMPEEDDVNSDIKPGEVVEIPASEEKPEPVTTEDVEEDHAQTAFNGAQVTSLVDLVKQVAVGDLPAEAAIEILQMAFQMSEEKAKAIISSATDFEPKSQKPQADNENPELSKPLWVTEDDKWKKALAFAGDKGPAMAAWYYLNTLKGKKAES